MHPANKTPFQAGRSGLCSIGGAEAEPGHTARQAETPQAQEHGRAGLAHWGRQHLLRNTRTHTHSGAHGGPRETFRVVTTDHTTHPTCDICCIQIRPQLKKKNPSCPLEGDAFLSPSDPAQSHTEQGQPEARAPAFLFIQRETATSRAGPGLTLEGGGQDGGDAPASSHSSATAAWHCVTNLHQAAWR